MKRYHLSKKGRPQSKKGRSQGLEDRGGGGGTSGRRNIHQKVCLCPNNSKNASEVKGDVQDGGGKGRRRKILKDFGLRKWRNLGKTGAVE
jgi:hypothetical protein